MAAEFFLTIRKIQHRILRIYASSKKQSKKKEKHMKTLIAIVAVCIFFAASFAVNAVEDDEATITSGQIVVVHLVTNGLVNLYSTNQLIVESYGNGGIAKKAAIDAVERNREFLKVLTKYAMDVKRQSARGDDKTVIFLGKVAETCTVLDLHLNAIEEYISKNDKASVNQLEKCREKAETLMGELLKSDLSE
jgi:hypothetical protein